MMKKQIYDNKILNNNKKYFLLNTKAAMVASFLALSIIATNIVPIFAYQQVNAPQLGGFELYSEVKQDEERGLQYLHDIHILQISGLNNKELQDEINKIYADKANNLKDNLLIRIATNTAPTILTYYFVSSQNDTIMSIGAVHSEHEINEPGLERIQSHTIDVEKGLLLTLPELFKDDTYIDIINESVKNQTKDLLVEALELGKISEQQYVDYLGENSPFKSIGAESNFFISDDYKLIIAFDSGYVLPAEMGFSQLIIPTEVIQSILVNNNYIK